MAKISENVLTDLKEQDKMQEDIKTNEDEDVVALHRDQILQCLEYYPKHLQTLYSKKQAHLLSTEETKDDIPHVFLAMQYNKSLTSLTLSGFNLDLGNVKKLAAILVNSPLKSLELVFCDLKNAETKELSTMLGKNNNLKSLNISNNNIGQEGAEYLGQALANNSCLESLNLSLNRNFREGANAIGKVLTLNSSLKLLNLHCCEINSEGFKALAKGLQVNNSLIELILSDNHGLDEGAIAIGDALMFNCSLKSLNLHSNLIRDNGCISISSALKNNKKIALNTLDLKRNLFIRKGIKSLGEALCVNSSLTSIDCSDMAFFKNWTESEQGEAISNAFNKALIINKTLISLELAFSHLDMQILSPALRANQKIQILNLDTNKIGPFGTQLISNILKVNSTITHLNLKNNQIDFEGVTSLCKVLRENNTLQFLSLASNSINEKGVHELNEVLYVNKTLTNLDLNDNNIGDTGTIVLCKSLEMNKGLTFLNLRRNNIHDKGFEALIKALAVNRLCNLDWLNFQRKSYESPMEECLMRMNLYNTILQSRLKFNWMNIAPIMRFMSNNANGQHPFQDSILALLPTIVDMAKTEKEVEDERATECKPMPILNMANFMNSKFFANQQQEGFLDKKNSTSKNKI